MSSLTIQVWWFLSKCIRELKYIYTFIKCTLLQFPSSSHGKRLTAWPLSGHILDSIISNQDCILFFWKYPPKPSTTETDLAKLWKQGLMMLSEFSAKAFHPWDSMKSLWLTITTIWFLAFSTTLGNLPKLSVISYQEAFLKHPTHHLKWTKINLRLLRQICGLCKKW